MSRSDVEIPALMAADGLPKPEPANASIRELLVLAGLIEDERLSARHPVEIDVCVLPVDEERKPAGARFTAITRNISVGGICFVHSAPTDAKYVLVELPGLLVAHRQLLARILRCRPTNGGSSYEIAGQFIEPADADNSALGR